MRLRAIATALLLGLSVSACGKPAALPLPPPAAGSGTIAAPITLHSLERKAESGDIEAAFQLGAIYHDGQEVPRDLAKARVFFEQAAKAGERRSQFNLGLMYLNGDGVEKDTTLARRWFERSAAQGNERASFQLGILTYEGNTVAQDFAAARAFFLTAAKGGIAEAQYNLGVMDVRGEGAAADLPEAYAWFAIAEKSGFAGAADAKAKVEAALTPEQKQQAEARREELQREMNKKIIRIGG